MLIVYKMDIIKVLQTSTVFNRVKEISDEMHGKTFHHHIYVLYELRTLLGPEKKMYTEIGTFNGGSLSLMLEHPYDTDYCCIDPCMYADQETNIAKNIKKYNKYGRRVGLFKEFSTSKNLLGELKRKNFKTDILFIDGDHSLSGVISDFNNYKDFVNPGGFIVFDDYNDSEYSPDVKKAVDMLKPLFNDYDVIGDFENIQKVYPQNLSRINEFIVKKKEPEDICFAICMATYQRKNYNSPFYLKRCLESIVNQSYSNWKLYVYGDKYEDDSEFNRILSESVPPEKLVKKNMESAPERERLKGAEFWRVGGVTTMNAARQRAMEDGFEWICHIDDDDYWHKEKLKTVNNVIRQLPKCCFLYSYSTITDRITDIFPKTYIYHLSYNSLGREVEGIHSTFVFHKKLLQQFKMKSFRENEHDVVEAGDKQTRDFIREFLKNNPDENIVFIPSTLVHHPCEGECKKYY